MNLYKELVLNLKGLIDDRAAAYKPHIEKSEYTRGEYESNVLLSEFIEEQLDLVKKKEYFGFEGLRDRVVKAVRDTVSFPINYISFVESPEEGFIFFTALEVHPALSHTLELVNKALQISPDTKIHTIKVITTPLEHLNEKQVHFMRDTIVKGGVKIETTI